MSCIVAEADRICGKITGNTTAKITSLHGMIYDKLIRTLGIEKARLYLRANEEALSKYRDMCAAIDCDFETKDAYTYSMDSRSKAEHEAAAVKMLGFNAEFADNLPLPFKTCGAVKFKNQAQFDPLKFVSAVAKNLCIYENTAVREIRGKTAYTDKGKIKAEKIIVATHFPFINKHGSYFLKMYQHRSYVLALDNAPDVGGMYVDESNTGLSFRNYNGMLLLGGGGHRTGKSGGSYRELEIFAEKYYPASRIITKFAAQDCITLDRIPYIGHYSKNTPNLYVAAGFNKWGMTSSMAAADVLKDMLFGVKNEFEELFNPSRTILKPQLAANAYEAAVNLVSFSGKRCPHLGCALKWNSAERTWDCPCHGSRFTEEGKLLDNPATGNLNK